jgi:glucose-6-phosphate 1-epimerase
LVLKLLIPRLVFVFLMEEADLVRIRGEDGASATVHLQGAQVLSWLTACGKEQLYLSKAAVFAAGVAIRGGVPVVFPQFSGLGALPKHGFARNLRWTLLREEPGAAVFRLMSSATTWELWPFAFALELEVRLRGQELALHLSVENQGDAVFSFMAALHTYLSVEDVLQVQVSGLQGLRFTDDVTMLVHEDSAGAVGFGSDVDRLYHEAGARVLSVSGGVTCMQEGFRDAVVWNPGPVTGGKIQDLDQPEGWRRFVCVEAAQVIEPVLLQPEQRWCGMQRLVAAC